MRNYINFSLIVGFVFCFLSGVFGQKFMQIEVNNEVETIKFFEGSKLTFKTNEYPDEWQSQEIERILVDDNVIVFKDQMININEIREIKLINGATKTVGVLFKTFGAGWFLFGGIAHYTTDNKFTWGQFGIGATAIGVGYLFDKVASKRIYKMGKNSSIRLLDISFPSPIKE